MNYREKIIDFAKSNTKCALCGSDNVNTRIEEKSFQHGSSESAPVLHANIPVHKCLDCDFEFTTSEAHMRCHEAVCRYLNILTPSEVKGIRKNLEQTQADFAEHTGIAIASINRWEKGGQIQSTAMDNYLFLLGKPGNFEALSARQQKSAKIIPFPEMFKDIDEDADLVENISNVFAL